MRLWLIFYSLFPHHRCWWPNKCCNAQRPLVWKSSLCWNGKNPRSRWEPNEFELDQARWSGREVDGSSLSCYFFTRCSDNIGHRFLSYFLFSFFCKGGGLNGTSCGNLWVPVVFFWYDSVSGICDFCFNWSSSFTKLLALLHRLFGCAWWDVSWLDWQEKFDWRAVWLTGATTIATHASEYF